MAFRSLRGHKVKVAIVGSLLAFGTFLLVLGTTLLGNIESAMEASITGSITGQIQLISANAKDRLTFFGPEASSEQDLATLEDFPRVQAAILGLPEVRAVVPMGRYFGQPILGSELDEALEAVDEALVAGDPQGIDTQVSKLRRMLESLEASHVLRMELDADREAREGELVQLRRATSAAFWEGFEEDPEASMSFLLHDIAKLGGDEVSTYLPFIGTDLGHFAASFDHFEIVEGELPREGERGFLANQPFYEEYMKNRAARALDKIHEGRTLDGKAIATDPGLQEVVNQLGRMANKITLQLGPRETAKLEADLRQRFPEVDGGVDELVTALFQVDDDNFDERYRYFYDEIVPHIRLYRVPVGSTFTLRSMTKSGYPKAVNVRLAGTFRFKGLDRSILASAYSLVDLATFRDLLGLMTADKRRELDAIRSELDLDDLDASSAEDLLFGGAMEVEAFDGDGTLDLDAHLAALQEEAPTPAQQPGMVEDSQAEGTILHAAVLLRDRAATSATVARINELSAREGLGVRAVPWSDVTGFIGQLVLVLRAILYVLIGIIFVVALVIINNSMVMATMDRIGEIGTMRAIGARRRFVLLLFLLETLVLGVISSAIGALGAMGLLHGLGGSGIPARGDFFIFLFGGPTLHPEVSVANAGLGLLVILVVSVLSTLYPARLAAKVAPVVAMQQRE
jgi:ABC-type lipoprotein release transport system permease subunit